MGGGDRMKSRRESILKRLETFDVIVAENRGLIDPFVQHHLRYLASIIQDMMEEIKEMT